MIICQQSLTLEFHGSSLAQTAALAYDHQTTRFANSRTQIRL
jgi:hypothetical protein